MPEKQIIFNLQPAIHEQVIQRCAQEKRSLAQQMRKLMEDFTTEDALTAAFRQRYVEHQPALESDAGYKRVAVKLPEEEYWRARATAAYVHLTLKEFAALILELWVQDALDEWLQAPQAARRIAGGGGDNPHAGKMALSHYNIR